MDTAVLFESMQNVANQVIGPAVDALEQLSWIGAQSHVVKLDFVDSKLLPVAEGLGMALPVIKYTVSLFLAYPFAAILRSIPNKNLKHLVSMLGGLFLVQWIFEADWIHSFISSAVTYLLCLIVPRKYCAAVVFVWAMGYMTGSHVYRMYTSYLSGIFDFTGTQMVLTMKLTSFAYNLYDGTADHAKVFADPSTHGKDAKMYAERKKFAVTSFPNPLEYFGYIYCFTCLLAGPAFEYNDYSHSIDGSAFQVKAGEHKREPSSVFPALKQLFISVIALAGHIVLGGQYPIKAVYDPAFIAVNSHLPRFGYLLISLFAERLKYYFAWKVAEGASVLGGFGFEGFDSEGKPKGWRGVENIDIISFETAPNVQTLSRAWNKRTQGWLERYTYQRSGKNLTITYFVSAFWHGLYPGFFIFFMSIPLVTNIERLVREKINPLIVPAYDGRDLKTYPASVVGWAYWFVCWFLTTISINYLVQVFSMSSYERCMTALGAYHHVPHISFFVIFVLLTLMPGPKKKKAVEGAPSKKSD